MQPYSLTMKNQLLFLLFLLCFHFSANAQKQHITDDSITYKRGIYRNYKEFVTNSPSITIDFTIVKKWRNTNFYSGGDFKSYRLVFPDSITIKLDSIWGMSDGTDIYINDKKSKLFFRDNVYEKLLFIGRYCYYETYVWGVPDIYTGNANELERKVFNINNGVIQDLTKEWLQKTLKNDMVLYDQFYFEGKKDKMLGKYTEMYSQKHKDEIKRNKYLN